MNNKCRSEALRIGSVCSAARTLVILSIHVYKLGLPQLDDYYMHHLDDYNYI